MGEFVRLPGKGLLNIPYARFNFKGIEGKKTMTLSILKPAASKCWLFATAGLLWSIVGILLCRTGWGWLEAEPQGRGILLEGLGVILAVAAFRFGFSRIAEKNIQRLRGLSGKRCFFAFQAWRSYLIIVFMIALGALLRSSPVDKSLLAVVYTTVGGALFLSSLGYYSHLRRLISRGKKLGKGPESK